MVASFALVFHELATNSAKYGAFAVAEGKLTVDAVFGPGTVTIDWTEEGVCPAAERGSRGGFGSTLLRTIVEGQFRGALQRAVTPAGFRLRLEFPAGLFPAEEGGPAVH